MVASGVAPGGLDCFRVRCGKRVYALEAVDEDPAVHLRCGTCVRRRVICVPPPVSMWSGVRRFDLVDSEEV